MGRKGTNIPLPITRSAREGILKLNSANMGGGKFKEEREELLVEEIRRGTAPQKSVCVSSVVKSKSTLQNLNARPMSLFAARVRKLRFCLKVCGPKKTVRNFGFGFFYTRKKARFSVLPCLEKGF